MFEAFYQSPQQHPVLLFLACALGAAMAWSAQARVHPSVRAYAALLVVVAALDAWLTSNDIPLIGTLPGALGTVIPVAFVIIGDLRYLLLAEALTDEGALRITARGFARALGWAFVVPVLAQLMVRFVWHSDEGRVLFLTYEVLFFALILARVPYVRRALPGPAARAWHARQSALALAWYGTWITADILILFLQLDVGYLARVVPNVLYYGAMPAVLVLSAPTYAAAHAPQHPSDTATPP